MYSSISVGGIWVATASSITSSAVFSFALIKAALTFSISMVWSKDGLALYQLASSVQSSSSSIP